jgi:hypothetical protein
MYAAFQVLTAVVIFWDITPCSPLKVGSACHLFHTGLLLGLFFDPAYGGDMFFRNVG